SGHNNRKQSQQTQLRESDAWTEQGCPLGGGGQDARGRGLCARTALTGAHRPSECRHASRVEWPATARTSTIFTQSGFLANDRFRRTNVGHMDIELTIDAPKM